MLKDSRVLLSKQISYFNNYYFQHETEESLKEYIAVDGSFIFDEKEF
jgi:hypothetical protein